MSLGLVEGWGLGDAGVLRHGGQWYPRWRIDWQRGGRHCLTQSRKAHLPETSSLQCIDPHMLRLLSPQAGRGAQG